MIAINNISKSFGDNEVVKGVSLTINKGEIFALLGPNGAGKTTTINMITGVLSQDVGSIVVNSSGNASNPEVRKIIGFVPQTLAFYESLSAKDNLLFFGKMQGLTGKKLKEQISKSLQIVNLLDKKNYQVKTFSEGMKRRLNIAIALLHEPKILILDEPTVGIDPQSRNAIFENIEYLKSNGCTILITSHHLDEAQRLCDRVGVMDEGEILAIDSVEKLIANFGGKSIIKILTDSGVFETETDDPVQEIIRLNKECDILSFQMESPSLESAFLKLTGKHLRD